MVERGHVSRVAVDRFLQAGFTHAQALEVVLAIAAKTLSNYVNHIAHLPDDEAARGERWVHPVARGEGAVA